MVVRVAWLALHEHEWRFEADNRCFYSNCCNATSSSWRRSAPNITRKRVWSYCWAADDLIPTTPSLVLSSNTGSDRCRLCQGDKHVWVQEGWLSLSQQIARISNSLRMWTYNFKKNCWRLDPMSQLFLNLAVFFWKRTVPLALKLFSSPAIVRQPVKAFWARRVW